MVSPKKRAVYLAGLWIMGLVIAPYACPEPSEIFHTEDTAFRKETLVQGLIEPWAMVKLPDGRLLVTERQGRIRVIEKGRLLPDPIGNVPEVSKGKECGLLDIELHPDYADNGWIYLALTKANNNGALTNVVRARLKDNALVDLEPIFSPPAEDYTQGTIHLGCRLELDGKGYLFFSIGDRGDITTSENRAQKLTHVAGKIHRLYDDGRIPPDNPFVANPEARPSIWCYGNRNPQGLRFQPGTGVLWESEHGPKGGDELNIIQKGRNYGWPIITYGVNDDGSPITDLTEKEGMEQPVTYWTPSIAVSAIDFYTGDVFPGWKGNLIVGSLKQQQLIRVVLAPDNTVVHQEVLLKNGGRIRDVHCWEDGCIYVLYSEGSIVKISPE